MSADCARQAVVCGTHLPLCRQPAAPLSAWQAEAWLNSVADWAALLCRATPCSRARRAPPTPAPTWCAALAHLSALARPHGSASVLLYVLMAQQLLLPPASCAAACLSCALPVSCMSAVAGTLLRPHLLHRTMMPGST